MISVLFNTLFFLIPLIFYKNTSELFEFNKIIILYLFTILILFAWAYKSIIYQKFVFRRTILDIPFILYLLILLLSTLFSMDPRSSWLGYYSRFNGGLISQICYAILYWAFVSNLSQKEAIRSTYYIIFSTTIASILAIAEHFGIFTTCALMGFSINESCWVQDVQSRVFSTLGQPNWLAALLATLIPISIYQFLTKKFLWTRLIWLLLTVLLFITLLFTKSRSGLLAFGTSSLVFWGFIFWKEKLKYLKEFILLTFVFVCIYFVINPPFVTRNLFETVSNGPALEVGGTESGTIRKYVWMGAFNIFKSYPVLGTGPETFAFAFSNSKPVEHNLTSEWDFIYNKAHNEYLNYMATTGLLGTAFYILIVLVSLLILFKSKRYELFTGYIAILVTNFFGFSVVPVSLLFYLLPAIAIVYSAEYLAVPKNNIKFSSNQLILIFILLGIMCFALNTIYNYWQADVHYNRAKITNSLDEINKAIAISPNEPTYRAEYARLSSDLVLELANKKDEENVKNFINLAVSEAQLAIKLSPNNINNKKILSGIYYKFALFNQNYLNLSEFPLIDAINISKYDPKLYYQLGIIKLKNNKIDEAVINFEKSIELKPNYKEARFALGLTYIDIKNYPEAIKHLEYSLQNIDPNDDLTKKYLQKAVDEKVFSKTP